MARSANCPVRLFHLGVNGSPLLTPNIGVLPSHRYSCEFDRWLGGLGSQRTRRSGGSLILEHSAKLLTRLRRYTPLDSVIAYCPSRAWNQTMYPAMGVTPATRSAVTARQPTLRSTRQTAMTAISGSPTERTTPAYPVTRPIPAASGTERRSDQQITTTTMVTRKA